MAPATTPTVTPAPASPPVAVSGAATQPLGIEAASAPNASTGAAPATGAPTSSAPSGTPIPGVPGLIVPPAPAAPWTNITEKDIAGLDFNVPPDQGIVSPMSGPDEEPEDFMKEQVDSVRTKLPSWPPGSDGDDLRCIRNLLYVAAVPDAIQMPVERYLPRVVYQHLLDTYPREKLTKILTYIALHPEEGMVIDDISDLGVEGTAGDPMLVRERAYLYAIKFIARLTGRVKE
jgi:hypothetical protein